LVVLFVVPCVWVSVYTMTNNSNDIIAPTAQAATPAITFPSLQRRIQKFGIRGGRVRGGVCGGGYKNFLKILGKNSAFSCKFFTCLRQSVNASVNEGGRPHPLNPPQAPCAKRPFSLPFPCSNV